MAKHARIFCRKKSLNQKKTQKNERGEQRVVEIEENKEENRYNNRKKHN